MVNIINLQILKMINLIIIDVTGMQPYSQINNNYVTLI
jgi:hypothetical protein